MGATWVNARKPCERKTNGPNIPLQKECISLPYFTKPHINLTESNTQTEIPTKKSWVICDASVGVNPIIILYQKMLRHWISAKADLQIWLPQLLILKSKLYARPLTTSETQNKKFFLLRMATNWLMSLSKNSPKGYTFFKIFYATKSCRKENKRVV